MARKDASSHGFLPPLSDSHAEVHIAGTAYVLARFVREEQLIPEVTPAPALSSECELTAYGAYLLGDAWFG
jgi:hypothetical protein